MRDNAFQATLARPVRACGVGLHTGRRSTVTIHPAPRDSGISFKVRAGDASTVIAGCHSHRVPSRMNTALGIDHRRKLRTVEHLLAALRGMEIDNAVIEVDGEELPIFDGSARPWCDLIVGAGRKVQPEPRRLIKVTAPFQICLGGSFIRAEPCDELVVDVTTDQLPSFGVMRWFGRLDSEVFYNEVSRSRSFGTANSVIKTHLKTSRFARLFDRKRQDRSTRDLAPARTPGAQAWSANVPLAGCPGTLDPDVLRTLPDDPTDPLLRGARPDRAAFIVGRYTLGGARFVDEPVRHKVVDLLGDLSLAGHPVLGRFVAHVPTHALTYAFVAMLMRSDAWELA